MKLRFFDQSRMVSLWHRTAENLCLSAAMIHGVPVEGCCTVVNNVRPSKDRVYLCHVPWHGTCTLGVRQL